MFIKNWKKEVFTIPNLLSFIRLILIPVYVIIYINAKNSFDYALSAAILGISCLTDLVDGKVARRYNMISTLGKILDPLADKATQLTLILCQTTKHPILWYLVGIFILKEGFQLIAGGITLHKGIMLKGALLSGKICTTILFISLIVMVLFPQLPTAIITVITIADAAFMAVAFIDYALTYRNMGSRFENLWPDEK